MARFLILFSIFADNVTIYFLKDILARRKRKLDNADVQTLHLPHYKCLSLEKIFSFIAG